MNILMSQRTRIRFQQQQYFLRTVDSIIIAFLSKGQAVVTLLE